MTGHNRIAVIHGVNLDQLGRRPAAIYGDITFTQLEQGISRSASELGLKVSFFQSNDESELIEHLHGLEGIADGILINPGAWTHYAWSIRDALEIAALPTVEIHLSDPETREEWRHVSVVRELCFATVKGKGPDGYHEALTLLRDHLEKTT
ncbi:MAG: 3-dehydroquinate dehydratase [Solirubrobacteraceae bacterium]|nr:3-dehydroquinate dehydratase [Solirubrobacteraceae bacterium]